MKNIYYLLWVDAIVNDKSRKNNDLNWKPGLLWIITSLNSLNFLIIVMWLDYLKVYKYGFIFSFSGNSFILGLLEALLDFFIPIGILHYLLVFYKDRYKIFIVNYPHFNGKLVLSYMFASIILFIGTIIFMW